MAIYKFKKSKFQSIFLYYKRSVNRKEYVKAPINNTKANKINFNLVLF